MSVHKYANLPDIDTAPDIYETEDVVPTPHDNKGDSSEDEANAPSRTHGRGKNNEGTGREELDSSSLMPDDASKKFRKAERKRHRPRIQYTYPPSPTSSEPNSPILSTPALPLSQRLRHLQAELAALETELADPSNPLLHKEREEGQVEPGELIRGAVDVRRRLDKISRMKEGRAKLVSIVLGEDQEGDLEHIENQEKAKGESQTDIAVKDKGKSVDVKEIAEIDERLGELEKIIGSSGAPLDEMSPLPPPLLPLLTRLNAQLTLLTQPRHIDSISRRLKLLLSDLDRASNTNQQHSQRRQATHHSATSGSPHIPLPPNPLPAAPSPLSEQLTPVLTRLTPLLPHIPHILTRLRTLSTLHTSAASFNSTLEGLEEEQRRVRAALEELGRAVGGVEQSLTENENVVKRNVKELEDRVENMGRRVDDLKTGIDE